MGKYALIGFLAGSAMSVFSLKTGYRKHVPSVTPLSWREVVVELPRIVVMGLVGGLVSVVISASWAKVKKDGDEEQE